MTIPEQSLGNKNLEVIKGLQEYIYYGKKENLTAEVILDAHHRVHPEWILAQALNKDISFNDPAVKKRLDKIVAFLNTGKDEKNQFSVQELKRAIYAQETNLELYSEETLEATSRKLYASRIGGYSLNKLFKKQK